MTPREVPAATGLAVWLQHGDLAALERLATALPALAVRHLRLGVSWADHHRPDGPGWLDRVIGRLAPLAELLPCVTYTPPHLGLAPRACSPPREPKAYADFLDLLVDRHGASFETVELWNEPNNLNDWDRSLDPDWLILCEMLGGAAYWMHQRGKRTVLGGFCPTDPLLLEHLRRSGVLEHVDVVGVHAFPGTWSTHWAGWEAEIAAVRAVTERCPHRPEIWVTETGYSTWRHDEPRQVEHFQKALMAPVPRVYWYAFEDLDPHVSSQEGFHVDDRHYHCGIVRSGGAPKLLHRMLAEGGSGELLLALRRAQRPRPARRGRPVLVTGGAGFLGANLIDRLATAGREVLLLDSLARPGVEANLNWLTDRHPRLVEPVLGDVRDPHLIAGLVADSAAVVHLAAQVAVTTSLADPVLDFEVNARGTLNVLEAARRLPAPPPLLFASTNKVYGTLWPDEAFTRQGTRWEPALPARRRGCGEAAPLDLHSPYGCSKGTADQYVLDYARVFGLRAAVLRMSCIYGPRQFGTADQGWVAHFMLATLRGRPVTLYGDGLQVRDVLFVDDAVDAYLCCLERIDAIGGRAFNLGGGPGNAVSLVEMLRHLHELTGVRPVVRHGARRPGDQLWYVSDTSAFTAATGWRAGTDVATGLRRLHAWLEGEAAVAGPTSAEETMACA